MQYVFNKNVWYHGVLVNLMRTVLGCQAPPSTKVFLVGEGDGSGAGHSKLRPLGGAGTGGAGADRGGCGDGDGKYQAEFCGLGKQVSGHDILCVLYAI